MEAYMENAYSTKNAGSVTCGFDGLPLELQDTIISHLPLSSVRALQQVSRHLHDRASRRLWRKLHFKLVPWAQSITGKSWQSQYRLVDVLRTITTSSHDYAQYIHDFEVKNPETGFETYEHAVATRFWPDTDAQKLLSISLFMLIRAATSLERFRWLTPVELDAACWKQVSRRKSLRRLDIQLNARSSTILGKQLIDTPTRLSHQYISDCSSLHSLAIKEIDDLNHLDDIAACIRSSAGSLKSLMLTFSQALASKAKKPTSSVAPPPPPPIGIQFDDADDLSSEEEVLDITHSSNGATPAIMDPELIKQNKSVQETALARILSVHSEKSDATMKRVEKVLKTASTDTTSRKPKVDEGLVKSIHELVDKIMQGRKVDDVKVLDQLRDRLDSATVSRSAKRQKASSIKKKTKPLKSNSSVPKNYGLGQIIESPDLSNTSSKTNPWTNNLLPSYDTASPAAKYYPYPTYPYQTAKSGPKQLTFPYQFEENDDPVFGTIGSMTGSSGKNPSSHFAFLSKNGGVPVSAESPSNGQYLANIVAASLGKATKLTKLAIPPGSMPPQIANSTAQMKKAALTMSKQFYGSTKQDVLTDLSESQSDGTSSTSESSPLETSIPEETTATSYDDMGVDLVHPDQVSDESGGEQEIDEEGEEIPQSVKDKGKGREITLETAIVSETSSLPPSQSKRAHEVEEETGKTLSPEQVMREWIRSRHGIALEELQLYLIPLKASVLCRALQLPCLKRVSLLSVGGQRPFWQLMCKAQEDGPLSLTDIYTDDVSAPFLQCVSRLQTVSKLVLRRRSSKAAENTTSKDPASIEDIRKLAVQPHMKTLQMLHIRNDHNRSWCLTAPFIWLLTTRGENLRELAFHSGTHRMWEFTKCSESPRGSVIQHSSKLSLENLVALHWLGTGPGANTNAGLTTGESVNNLGQNGEPIDAHHDLWARDSYRKCREALGAWAKHRREHGDSKLKYIGVDDHPMEVGAVKEIRKIPEWLRDEFEFTAKRSREQYSDEDLQQWISENDYESWVNQKQIHLGAKRWQDCKAHIFTSAVRKGQL